jgi:hypothetical protein
MREISAALIVILLLCLITTHKDSGINKDTEINKKCGIINYQ